MAYFSNFPLVNYQNTLQVNLTRRVDIASMFKQNEKYYLEYSVRDGETPEMIADRFYDDAQLHWIILLMNDILNPFYDWPMSQLALESYINEKYDNPNGINHYISVSTGNRVDPQLNPVYDTRPVTNYEYETDLNDEKRNVKLLLPEFTGIVMNRQKELMRV
jgi:hypothetical protein